MRRSRSTNGDALVRSDRTKTELLVDFDGAARLLGVGRTTVKSLVYGGELASVLVGSRCRRIAVVDIEAYVQRLREEGGAGLGGPAPRKRVTGDQGVAGASST